MVGLTEKTTIKVNPTFVAEVWADEDGVLQLILTPPRGRTRRPKRGDYERACKERGVPMVICEPFIVPSNEWTVDVGLSTDHMFTDEQRKALKSEINARLWELGENEDPIEEYTFFESLESDEARALIAAWCKATGALLCIC
jgi:hypothetical protein